MLEFINFSLTNDIEIIFKLGCIFAISCILGLERESNPEPAGLRTHILIGVGSCLITLIALFMMEVYSEENVAAGRIMAAIISGIGFLGAGSIIKFGSDVKGLTTAATIWMTAAIGMGIGVGFYIPTLIVVGIVLFDLIVISRLKTKFLSSSRISTLIMCFDKKDFTENTLKNTLDNFPHTCHSNNIIEYDDTIELKILFKMKQKKDIYEIRKSLQNISKAKKISIYESSTI